MSDGGGGGYYGGTGYYGTGGGGGTGGYGTDGNGTGGLDYGYNGNTNGSGSGFNGGGTTNNSASASPGGDTDTVTVTGKRITDVNDIGQWYTGWTWGAGYIEESSGVGKASGPQDATLSAIESKAKLLEAAIKSKSDWQSKEYEGLIYKDPSGNLQITDVKSSGKEGTVTASFALPSGSEIEGWVHNQPADTGVDEREPSSGDWDTVSKWIGSGVAPSVTADPGAMTYILDVASGNMYEYAPNQMGTKSPGSNQGS